MNILHYLLLILCTWMILKLYCIFSISSFETTHDNFSHLRQPHHMFLQAIAAPQLQISLNCRSKSKVPANDAYSAQKSTFSHTGQYIILIKIYQYFRVMLLTDVYAYDSDVLHPSISTKTYWWHQLLSNGWYLFVHHWGYLGWISLMKFVFNHSK